MMKRSECLIFDIETDNLLKDVTKIHCIAIEYNGQEYLFDTPEGIEKALLILENWEGYIVGHNLASYDIPVIKKLYPMFTHKAALYDTLLVQCILEPEDGILSLEDWAKRLSLETQKVQHEDWSTYNENMGIRCQADVKINGAVLDFQLAQAHIEKIKDALELEQDVARIHSLQHMYGVLFDKGKAEDLLDVLDAELQEVRKRIVSIGPWRTLIPGQTLKYTAEIREKGIVLPGVTPFLKQKPGKPLQYNVNAVKYFGKDIHQVHGDYCKVEFVPFNPDSSDEVRKLLLDLGWIPLEWNTKRDKMTGEYTVTSPKLTEESFASLPDGLGRDIATYNTLSHRRSWLMSKDGTGGALNNINSEGRINSEAFTCATNTGRYRHQGTVCNIPRVTTIYGKEMRDLFCVPNDKVQVGVDLEGIEARCLALYLLRHNYSKAAETTALILSPDKGSDFHSFNANQWGVSRDTAKSVLYALLYGAGAAKLAATACKPKSMGAKLKRDFYLAHPGIKELIDDLETAYNAKGYINGFDGRPLVIRQRSRLLNTLLQSTAAIIFKRWMIILDAKAQEPKFLGRVRQIIAYHDELQFECDREIAEDWRIVCEETAILVGKMYGIELPIAAAGKLGRSWKDCH